MEVVGAVAAADLRPQSASGVTKAALDAAAQNGIAYLVQRRRAGAGQ
jgi:hypothetical protein